MANIKINPPETKWKGLQEVLSNCKFPEVMDCDSRDQSIYSYFLQNVFSMVKDSVDCMLVSSCPRLLSLMDYYSCFLTYGGSPILEYKP